MFVTDIGKEEQSERRWLVPPRKNRGALQEAADDHEDRCKHVRRIERTFAAGLQQFLVTRRTGQT
jgi:hypothetical protein